MDNLEEMDKFLKTHKLRTLKHEETVSEQTSYLKGDWISYQKHSNKENSGSDDLRGDSTKILKRINTSSSQTFPNTEEEETFPNSFYNTSITLTPKPHKGATRKLQDNIPHESICKISQQNTKKWNSTAH